MKMVMVTDTAPGGSQKPGTSPEGLVHVGVGTQVLQSPSTASPGTLAGNWTGSGGI